MWLFVKKKIMFLGPQRRFACCATFQGSQACSALRRLCRLGLAFGHPFTSLGRSAPVGQ